LPNRYDHGSASQKFGASATPPRRPAQIIIEAWPRVDDARRTVVNFAKLPGCCAARRARAAPSARWCSGLKQRAQPRGWLLSA
jgi:hypothetical protein